SVVEEAYRVTEACSFKDPNACASSQKDTPSSAPSSNQMSLPADLVKPSSSPFE
ncbi:hypothetical protein Tco_0670903, partial [Tanacetum coccineum]